MRPLAGASLGLHEVLLDQADGLEWETAVRCDLIRLLERARFLERRGRVSLERQVQISRRQEDTFTRRKPRSPMGGIGVGLAAGRSVQGAELKKGRRIAPIIGNVQELVVKHAQ